MPAYSTCGSFNAAIRENSIKALQGNSDLSQKINSAEGAAWGALKAFFIRTLPEHLDNKNDFAYELVAVAMNSIYGQQGTAWESYRNPERDMTSYVRLKR